MKVIEMLKAYMNNDQAIVRIIVEDNAGYVTYFDTNEFVNVLYDDEECLNFEVSSFWVSDDKKLMIYAERDDDIV